MDRGRGHSPTLANKGATTANRLGKGPLYAALGPLFVVSFLVSLSLALLCLLASFPLPVLE
uniref:Uncharacterized protein n=1 Tax=Leersia perrieri TaxID=77586 RepID=A0A0D9WMW2_9ORYZ